MRAGQETDREAKMEVVSSMALSRLVSSGQRSSFFHLHFSNVEWCVMKYLLNEWIIKWTNEWVNERGCVGKDDLFLNSPYIELCLFHGLIGLEILAGSFSVTHKWTRGRKSLMVSGPLCLTFVSDSQIWGRYPGSLSSHSSLSKLFMGTGLDKMGRALHGPHGGFSAVSFQSSDRLSNFPGVLLLYSGCQHQPHLLGKEMKGRMVGGLPYQEPLAYKTS